MCRTQRRRHRPDLDTEGSRDRAVVEIGVVAEKDDQALPIRQRSYPHRNLRLSGPVAVPAPRPVDSRRLVPRQTTSPRRQRGIHHQPPHPRLQRPLMPERVLFAQRLREPFLHSVVPARLIANDRRRHTQELPVAQPVCGLKLSCEKPSSAHHTDDAPEALVCLASHGARGSLRNTGPHHCSNARGVAEQRFRIVPRARVTAPWRSSETLRTCC